MQLLFIGILYYRTVTKHCTFTSKLFSWNCFSCFINKHFLEIHTFTPTASQTFLDFHQKRNSSGVLHKNIWKLKISFKYKYSIINTNILSAVMTISRPVFFLKTRLDIWNIKLTKLRPWLECCQNDTFISPRWFKFSYISSFLPNFLEIGNAYFRAWQKYFFHRNLFLLMSCENLICQFTRFYIPDLPNAKIFGKEGCYSLHTYTCCCLFSNAWKFIHVIRNINSERSCLAFLIQ